ncbi:MAG: hypothetical protein EAX95_01140 [Candidatus Thorarchaeota archaeon]|nr:hypothetical protein [Candidatus Thorarchaeota archaeon]
MQMKTAIMSNKFLTVALLGSIIFAGMTFGNLPGPATTIGVQTINGITFNFADYQSLNREQIGMFNYFADLVTDRPYNDWQGWYSEDFRSGRQYLAAFTSYVLSMFFETTSGYRTSAYQEVAYSLVKMMNTTIEEYGNDSMEYWEWESTSYPGYYYPDPNDPTDFYVGEFRGPANIMWTGHYALTMALYERNFNTGEFKGEINWFIDDWQNSLTTDGYGNAKEGGIWGIGLIPCEPYIAFIQCNSIAVFATELFDNLYNTSYMESRMWDYGLNFANTEMQDEYGLFSHSYLVSPLLGSNDSVDDYPKPTMRGDNLAVSSYGASWAMMFLEYTQENETINDYERFIEVYGRDLSSSQMYMLGSYHQPGSFTDLDTVLGSFFTMALANQRGDHQTVERLRNFWLSPCNKIWSEDGRAMHYQDGIASLYPLLQPVSTGLGTWGTFPVTIRNLADARPTEFWDYPYISEADDDNIWVYQAEWDPHREAFILNIEVDRQASLTFSNFNAAPTAYAGGIALQDLSPTGGDFMLSLSPGIYNLVIM